MYIKLFESFFCFFTQHSQVLLCVLLQDLALGGGKGPPLLNPKFEISFTWTLFYTVKRDTKQPQHKQCNNFPHLGLNGLWYSPHPTFSSWHIWSDFASWIVVFLLLSLKRCLILVSTPHFLKTPAINSLILRISSINIFITY